MLAIVRGGRLGREDRAMYGYGVEPTLPTEGYSFPLRATRETPLYATVTPDLPSFPRRITRARPSVASGLPSIAGLVSDTPALPSFERPPVVTASEAGSPEAFPYPTPTRDTGIGGWLRGLLRPRPAYPTPSVPAPTPRTYTLPRGYVAPRTYYTAPRYYYYVPGGAGALFAPGVYGPGEADAASAPTQEAAAIEAPPTTETPWLLYAGLGLAAAGGYYLWKKQKKG